MSFAISLRFMSRSAKLVDHTVDIRAARQEDSGDRTAHQHTVWVNGLPFAVVLVFAALIAEYCPCLFQCYFFHAVQDAVGHFGLTVSSGRLSIQASGR